MCSYWANPNFLSEIQILASGRKVLLRIPTEYPHNTYPTKEQLELINKKIKELGFEDYKLNQVM